MTSKRSLILIFLLFLPHTVFAATRYVVKKGDSLYRLSKKFNVSVNELEKANKLDSNNLNVGDIVLVPDSTGANDKSASVSQGQYVVSAGDTLNELGQKVGVSSVSIESAGKTPRIGQNPVEPSSSKSDYIGSKETNTIAQENKPEETGSKLSPAGIQYTVRKGDTLGVIAKSFGIPLSELKAVNGLRNDTLKAGKVLIIPRAVNEKVVRETSPKPVIISGRYVVQKGDSLHGLSKRFGISVESIKEASGIEGSDIGIGQVLTLPGNQQYADSYNVKLPDSDALFNSNDYTMSQAGDRVSRGTIIKVAKRFLGAPYKFGGTSTVMGIDCSAFVNKVFDFFNINLPRTARDIYKVGRSVAKTELATGDLVFFRTYASYPSHVGIYIDNDEFIHASSAARKVTIDSINRSYYRKRYIGAKRIEVSGLFYGDLSEDYKGFEIQ